MDNFEKKLGHLQQQTNNFKKNDLCIDLKLIQDQINSLKTNYLELVNKGKKDNTRYEQIVDELNNLYELIGNNSSNSSPVQYYDISPAKTIFTCTNQIHQIVIDKDIDFIFVTIIAGGGAGGIGFIRNMYYYSGGGGGAGSCFIKKPVSVKKNYTLRIKVGKGGDIMQNKNGEHSYVKVYNQCGKCEYKVFVSGGKNGYPSYSMITSNVEHVSVCGGYGGENCNSCFSGNNGCDGKISIPSQFVSSGGNGACSHFYEGGDGGGNYFNCGGSGGVYSDKICGQDGKYGSGGGGSAPKMNINPHTQNSGNGGDGMVMIEWC